MYLKSFGLLAPVVLGGLWVSGVLGGGYERTVDRPPSQVIAALADLDIRNEPGAPGTDPSRAGGVTPMIRMEHDADSVTWTVMSGNQVATRMIAHLESIDGGRRTRVTAEVVRGDAPDDFVSPAFRSKGLTMGLFSMALEGELDELTSPPGDPEHCRQLTEQITRENEAAHINQHPENLRQAAGSAAQVIIRINAMHDQLRRAGCLNLPNGNNFSQVSNRMGSAPPEGAGGVSFEPGRPMVDVSHDTRRH
jgi:hypothetical protein